MMEGIATHAPVIGYLSKALPDTEFMLIDVGCSGGIDGAWRSLGPRLRALAIDPNIAEIERLRSVETHPGIRYLAALAGLPSDHPFALQKAGQSHWGRSPWARLTVAKSLQMMKSVAPLPPPDMVAANQWTEMKLADEVIVIPAYLRDRGIASFDFLKIDVDGADFDILNSLHQDLDPLGVLRVGIEINYFGSTSDTDHTFHNVDRFMRARGFELFGMTVNRYSLGARPSRNLGRLPARRGS